MPKWEDLGLWKTHFDAGDKKTNRRIYTRKGDKDHVKLLNSHEELRDECYKLLVEELKKNEKECSGSAGWCETCLFAKEWYPEGKNY